MTLEEKIVAAIDRNTEAVNDLRRSNWNPPLTTPISDLANRSWNAHLAKQSLRLAVELAHVSKVPLETLAKELIDELG